MNRRSFFAALAGAPVAVVAGASASSAIVRFAATPGDIVSAGKVPLRSLRAHYLHRCFWSGLISANDARELMADANDPRWSALPVIAPVARTSGKSFLRLRGGA